jgi:glutamate carboxypeptidase
MFDPLLQNIALDEERREELLREWVQINSGTFNLAGLAAMEAELIDAFDCLGGTCEKLALPPAQTVDAAGHVTTTPLGRALRFTKRPHAPLKILLNIHYDTVYPADSPFKTIEAIDADTIRGPGVVDAKGGILVLLAALEALEASKVCANVGWEVLLNPDEEIGSPGSNDLLKDAAKRNHLGLVFEPAFPDGMLVGARKGSGTYTAIVRGRAAHAGRDFDQGRSAILALADFIQRVDAVQTSAGGVTINCGKVEGGGATNIVPDLAIGRFNVRATTPDDQVVVEKIFADAAAQVRQRDGITVDLHGGFNSPPKLLDPRSERLLDHVIACGRSLGLSLAHRSSGGTCDGSKLAAAGLPVVDSLGPIGGELHSEREYVRLSSITQRAQLVALLLLRLASGELARP